MRMFYIPLCACPPNTNGATSTMRSVTVSNASTVGTRCATHAIRVFETDGPELDSIDNIQNWLKATGI